MDSSPYFAEAEGAKLSIDQARVIDGIRRCIEEIQPTNLEASGASATFDKAGSLELVMRHRDDPKVKVRVIVDEYDEIVISSPTLHATFGLRYNVRWEPEDGQGDLDDAVKVICALISGRVESEILWGGDLIARSRDVIVESNGDRRVLYTQYHADGLFGAILNRKREIRRIGFV